MDWTLECVNCGNTSGPEGLPTVCTNCGQPWLVRYPDRVPVLTDRAELRRRHGMWRFRPFLPLTPAETPSRSAKAIRHCFTVRRLGKSAWRGFTLDQRRRR